MNKQTFFTASLSNLSPAVSAAVSQEYQHHRTPWMEDKLSIISRFFKQNLGATYTPITLTATHTGAHEAFIANTAEPGDHILTQAGTLWADVATTVGATVTTFDPIKPPTTVACAPKIICLDTTLPDGRLVPLKKVITRFKTKYPKAIVLVNAGHSFGADPLPLSDLPVDGYIIVPERALAGIAGLTIVAVHTRLFPCIEAVHAASPEKPYTFDLIKYRTAWQKSDTPYSPDISAAVGLGAALSTLTQNGDLSSYNAAHQARAHYLRTKLATLGLTPVLNRKTSQTNAFTQFHLPAKYSATRIITHLKKAGLIIEPSSQPKTIQIGHTGYLTPTAIDQLIHALAVLLKKPTPASRCTINPHTVAAPIRNVHTTKTKTLSISSQEWSEKLLGKTHNATPIATERYSKTNERLFTTTKNLTNYRYQNRTLGFIGAGNTVREAVACCQQFGITDIRVFSPSLAGQVPSKKSTATSDDHATKAYWEARGVTVASSAEEIYLQSHTVVLLPTFYNKTAASLMNKTAAYTNEASVNDALLQKIEAVGVMDLLINMSAREDLIDRKALAKHLKKGWLQFMSDEDALESDPVAHCPGVLMSAHIAGSSNAAQQAVATNTHHILAKTIAALQNRAVPARSRRYTPQVINDHHKPRAGWRLDAATPAAELKILLTDKFDIATLDFAALEQIAGVPIRVTDISQQSVTESDLIAAIQTHQPHIMLIRTRTVITDKVATALTKQPHFTSLIRPGVGIDNIYSGLKTVSQAGIQIINEPYGNSRSVGELTTRMVVHGTENVILTPGPTKYHQAVFAVTDQYVHPSTSEFKTIQKAVCQKLTPWIGLGSGQIVHSTPSTGFLEAAITNLTVAGDRGLIVAHGKFGNRFKEISQATGRHPEMLEVTDKTWGTVHTPAAIKAFLNADAKRIAQTKQPPLTYITVQQNETSTGVAFRESHLKAIAAAARTYNPHIMIILDGVSGTFAHNIDMTKLDIDIVVLGSQKALGVSSGITYTSLSARALQKLLTLAGYAKNWQSLLQDPKRYAYISTLEQRQRIYYLSLLRILVEDHDGRSSHVPSVFHILSTYASLQLIETVSKEELARRSATLAKLVRQFVQTEGLKLLVQPPYLSDAVTPILLPKRYDARLIRKQLEIEYGILISGAQAEYWKPSLVRIGHLGYLDKRDIVRCLRALRIILRANK